MYLSKANFITWVQDFTNFITIYYSTYIVTKACLRSGVALFTFWLWKIFFCGVNDKVDAKVSKPASELTEKKRVPSQVKSQRERKFIPLLLFNIHKCRWIFWVLQMSSYI
jgi:hypothetical protein